MGCLLQETKFSGSYISGSNFSGAEFTGVAVKYGGFVKNTVVDAVWNRTSFITSQISDIVFYGTLEDCSFENCTFSRVTYAFLKNGKADLTGITLLTP